MNHITLQIQVYEIGFSHLGEMIIKKWIDNKKKAIKIVRITDDYIETEEWYNGRMITMDTVSL